MGYKVDKIFEDCACLGKVHSKEQYKVNSDKFKEERYSELETLVKAQDVEAECRQFCEDVFMTFKKFGKVRGTDRMNLNYFMIFYVFPTILSEEGDKAAEICETLKNTWNSRFKANIAYTDYNTLLDGFEAKIFGIPIGRD